MTTLTRSDIADYALASLSARCGVSRMVTVSEYSGPDYVPLPIAYGIDLKALFPLAFSLSRSLLPACKQWLVSNERKCEYL